MPLTGSMTAELSKARVLMFTAVEILLPAANVRLLDGAGMATFSGKTFVGRDPTYGVLAGATAFTDGVDDQAPSLTITLMEADLAAQAAFSAAAAQGSAVSVWVGCIDQASGLVIADPDLAFVGELDFATWKVGPNSRAIELSVVSVLERFFDQDEGQRLNNGHHTSIWTGETGLEFTGQVQVQIPWGSDAPRPNLITHTPQVGGSNPDLGAGGYGGGFFFPAQF